MSELPKGWQFALLGEIGSVQSGVGFPNEYQGLISGDYPVYKVGDVSRGVTQNNGKLQSANNYVTTEVAKLLKGQIFEAGSTLFAKIGEALKLNRRGFVITPGLADNNVMGYKSQSGINDRFMYYFLHTQDFAEYSRSTTVPSIRKGDIEGIRIALPPSAEQARIAQKLDELLAQVETLKARIDAIPALFKRFRQSVLAAAVSGRLTEDWRGGFEDGADCGEATTVPTSWVLTRLDKCVHAQNGKTFPSADYRDAGVRLIRPGNLHVTGRVVWTDSNTVCLDETYLSGNDRYLVRAGDIVMNLTAQSLKDDFLGRVCIYADESPALLNQRQCVFVFKSESSLMKKYLFWYFRSPQFRAFVDTLDSGSLIKHMYTKQLSDHEIAVPPPEEQTEIVRRVEQLFAFADQLEAKVASAKSRIDHLTQSILAKAFRGELVPQDPNDEPASVLLERIQTQRASAPKAKRGRKASA